MQADHGHEKWCFDNLAVRPVAIASLSTIVPGRRFSHNAQIRFQASGSFINKPDSTIYTTSLESIERALACIEFIQTAADVSQDISEHIPTPAACMVPLSPFDDGEIFQHLALQLEPDQANEEAFAYLWFRFIQCPLVLEAIRCLIGFFKSEQNVVYQHCVFDNAALLYTNWRPDPRRYSTLDETYSVCASYARTVLKHFFSAAHRDQLSHLEVIFLYHQLYYCHIYPVICVYEFETVVPQDFLPLPTNGLADHRAVDFLQIYHRAIVDEVFQRQCALLITSSEFIPELHLVPVSSSIGTKGWGFSRSFSLFTHFTHLQQQGKEFGLTHELLHQYKLVYPTPLHDFHTEKKKAKRGDPTAKPILRIHPGTETTKRWFFAQWKKHVTQDKKAGIDRVGADEFTCLLYYYLNRKATALIKLDSLMHEVRKIATALKAMVNLKKQWYYLKSSSKLVPFLATMRAEMQKIPQRENKSTFYNKYHTFASTCLTRLK